MAKDTKNNKDNKSKDNKDIKNKKHFFKDFKAELKRVIWPTPKQVTNSTMAVITIVLVTALIVFILDAVFNILNENGINKFKSTLKQNTVQENVIEGDNTQEGEAEENTDTENSEDTASEDNNQVDANVEE